MQTTERARAVAAAVATAAALDLAADDAVVLHDSNRLALRLTPCDVLARVEYVRPEAVAAREVALARQLAEAGCPVGVLEPRVEPRVYERAGFLITLWTYYEPISSRPLAAAEYADALERLHRGLRSVELTTQHFTDRVAEAERLVASHEMTPALDGADRSLLSGTLASTKRAIAGRGATEQLLHGEPHPGNLLATLHGPRFIDLETCCRGPVEFDLAHAPDEVSDHYPGLDRALLGDCRLIVLAMVAAWRWDRRDQLPNRERAAHLLLAALREGPPYPALDAVMRSD